MPAEEDVGKAYRQYYTHQAAITKTFAITKPLLHIWRSYAVPVLSAVNPVYLDRKNLALMYLNGRKTGKVLDVGCGDGYRLAQLRKLGWDVCGQDVDPKAAAYGREKFQIDIRVGPLGDVGFPEEFFDFVLLHHVIEHVHEPIQLLRQCKRLLKKNGELILVTPNSNSVSHKHFGAHWRGLEPPRHIFIFSRSTLAGIAQRAGFSIRSSRTTSANTNLVTLGSLQVRRNGRRVSLGHKIFRLIYSIGFQYYASLRSAYDPDVGEECVLQLT
jgi:2-polyprenyl-3-methyl-5-hydroxy-6-metoxy-1,4-benzoquinol methylase